MKLLLQTSFWMSVLFLNQCDFVARENQNNAVWAAGDYFRGTTSSNDSVKADDVRKFAKRLKLNNVKYAYIFAGPYDKNGFLPGFAFSVKAKQTVVILKQSYPELIVLPWIGGVQNKSVFLGDSIWTANALNETKKLVDALGVPGVHIDFEFIVGSDSTYSAPGARGAIAGSMYAKNVNDFHRKLRILIPSAFISSVVLADCPGTKPWKRKSSTTELEELIKHIDQISFLYYDTRIDNQQDFANNAESLMQIIQQLKSSERFARVQYLVSIGTFVNEIELRKFRNMNVENIPNTIQTLKRSEKSVSSNRTLIDGISIYCDWETDRIEWSQFRKYWIDNQL